MTSIIPITRSFNTPAFHASVSMICQGSDQAMVYGWKHCGYTLVESAIQDNSDNVSHNSIKKTYDFNAGDPLDHGSVLVTTAEGRKINLIDYDAPEYNVNRMCKTGITNVVLENYKRQKEGLSLIPVLFVIDITGNPHPYSSQMLCSKEPKINAQVTHKELRRAFKLCTHPNPKIRRIALETFKFIKIDIKENGTPIPEQIPAPWGTSVESPEKVSSTFVSYWQARHRVSRSKPKPEKYDWSKQLEKHIARYDRVSHMQAAMASQALQTKQRLDARVIARRSE